jgi:hypothetical protein
MMRGRWLLVAMIGAALALLRVAAVASDHFAAWIR